eukprot:Nk52_evm15s270 gene=Nk52_evmTU15s270
MYDPSILAGFCTDIDVPTNLLIRPLAKEDYEKGYLDMLTQLTTVGDITKGEFEKRFDEMVSCENTYRITVVEDLNTKKLVCCGTIFIEKKYIHRMAARGHIEDIVVDENYRGMKLGKLIIEVLTHVGKKCGCYKISLDCDSKNVPFYQKCGYIHDDKCFMYQRYDK